jgi:rubrerythrin
MVPLAMAVHRHSLDRILMPVHRWVWRDAHRRGHKLLRFALTEADGGRDLSRAAELTKDALLRRLFLRHALDEQRHANLFRQRGSAILASLPNAETAGFQANFFAPGERGLDDLRVERERDDALLAFLHLSEKAAAQRFTVYEGVLAFDRETQGVFAEILRDEAFHMNYTYAQLTRVSPRRSGLRLWTARLSRLWKGYLRIATAIANVMGGLLLTVQYFLILPLFALMAKRSARRLSVGWRPSRAESSLGSQY